MNTATLTKSDLLELTQYLTGEWEKELPEIERQSIADTNRARLTRWMNNRLDLMAELGLAKGRSGGKWNQDLWTFTDWRREDCGVQLYPHSLMSIGVQTPTQANNFIDLYLQVCNRKRSWTSGFQVDHQRVANIALCKNYTKLPLWVKKNMLQAPQSAKIGGERVGDIWRLFYCAKSWKWAPLPKSVAEKVGRLSPRMRMLSAWAFEMSTDYSKELTKDGVKFFWENLQWLSQLTVAQFIEATQDIRTPVNHWGKVQWTAFLSESLGIPYGVINLEDDGLEVENLLNVVRDYGSPEQVCHHFFGVAGKATQKAFQKCCTADGWRWAKALAFGNADQVQKILSLPFVIKWEPEVVNFLKILSPQTQLKLLQQQSFKYRGEEHPLTSDHIRDTGYLWNQFPGNDKPNIGRVRCWFSAHEALSKEFIEKQPDQVIPLPHGWEHIDGLSAIDKSWELKLPESVETLKSWGRTLQNCVGGYAPAIKSGRSVVIGVLEGGIITHCIEITGSVINQFYAARNQEAIPEIKESIVSVLQSAKLI